LYTIDKVAKKNTSRVVFTHITIGLELAITVLIFVYGGYKLDEHYNKSPLFVTIGAVIGMVAGFYNLMKTLNAEQKREKEQPTDKESESRKKVKWM
jgi:F0F1-type ATP synthase assembly protein I